MIQNELHLSPDLQDILKNKHKKGNSYKKAKIASKDLNKDNENAAQEYSAKFVETVAPNFGKNSWNTHLYKAPRQIVVSSVAAL